MFTNRAVKLLALVLALIMVFALALTGCKNKTGSDDDDNSSSSSSSSSAPSTPATNEESKALFDKYPASIPDTKTEYFKDMEYVSLVREEEDDGLFIIEYGYKGDEVLKIVQISVIKREYLVEEEIVAENTDAAINQWYNEEMLGEILEADFITSELSVQNEYIVITQAIERNDQGVRSDVFDRTLSENVAYDLDDGFILKFGNKSDYVKEGNDDNTSSSDKKVETSDKVDIPVDGGGDKDQGQGGNGEVIVKNINPEYEALFTKYGFNEPRVMAGGKYEILAEDSNGEGIELYYYFADKDGKVVQAIAYAILTREAFAEQFNVENNDTAIKGVVDMLPAIYEQFGFEANASYDDNSVLVQMSVTENNTDMDIDFIGKKLSDVVADEIADGAVKKFID